MEYCYWEQHYLSLVLMGTEANSRYPSVSKRQMPAEIYSEAKLLAEYPKLIEVQENSITWMKYYSIEK